MGQISEHQFREALRKDLNLNISDDEIDEAWNTMLGDIPLSRVEEVKQLSKKYRCAVLSNTNAIHEKAFHNILKKTHGYQHLNELFHQVHFSHELKLRKPNDDIYLRVLELQQVEANTILFLDDTLPNLMTAEKLGYNTLHIPRNQGFETLLSEKDIT
jgi:putative hydrolase of the HAD superfamily